MIRLVDFLFGVRKEEVRLAAVLFSGYGLILLTYFFLKPARDSLFLVGPGPSNLPAVFVLIALVALPVTLVYGRLARILDLNRLIQLTSAVLIGCLLLLRWLLALEIWWIYYAFYVWVDIYGILTTSQFWLFANSVLNSAQAKRIFAVVNLGGILGAIIGGESAGFLVGVVEIPTRDLLLFCAGFLALSTILLNRAGSLARPPGRTPATAAPLQEPVRNSLREARSMLRDHRHLAGIGGLLFLSAVVATLVVFQFKTVAVQAYPDQQALAAFLGKFYGRLNIVSLLLQTFLTYRLIRFWGVSGAILLLPLGLLFTSVGMLAVPTLWGAVILRGIDGSLRPSVDKTGRELLFLPVPLEVKKRAKVFIDLFVDRWSRGLAGGLLLVLTSFLHFSVNWISMAIIVLAGLWVVLALAVRRG
ncbi:MAG: Npt1/Npt2 family nucleotide transporter [Acidobacteriota bacterium]|nr:Npt1/Npt2 family nucleotide transporter [Acidobacteriota bacterium]